MPPMVQRTSPFILNWMKAIVAERTASTDNTSGAAPIAQFPFLNHGTAIKPQPGRLLDKADVNRDAEEGGGDSECIETGRIVLRS